MENKKIAIGHLNPNPKNIYPSKYLPPNQTLKPPLEIFFID